MSGTTGVTTVPGANGSTFYDTSGSNVIQGSATGNDTVYSAGIDTINPGSGNTIVFASGSSATVNPGMGIVTFVAGSGNYLVNYDLNPDTLYGGSGNNFLYGGGKGSIIVAGTGNTTLHGGSSQNTLYGGSGADNFISSGSNVLVGGTGTNSFALGGNDTAFGGAKSNDIFAISAGSANPAIVVEGNGNDEVNIEFGSGTVFSGSGSNTYLINTFGAAPQTNVSSTISIVNFKQGDIIKYNFGEVSSASIAAGETKGSFGSSVYLNGTRINFIGFTATEANFQYTTEGSLYKT